MRTRHQASHPCPFAAEHGRTADVRASAFAVFWASVVLSLLRSTFRPFARRLAAIDNAHRRQ